MQSPTKANSDLDEDAISKKPLSSIRESIHENEIQSTNTMSSNTINLHKRNRQLESDAEINQPVESPMHSPKSTPHWTNLSHADSDPVKLQEPLINVNENGDPYYDRCSMAKKPRDDKSIDNKNACCFEREAITLSANTSKNHQQSKNPDLVNSPSPATEPSVEYNADGTEKLKPSPEDYSDDDDDYDDLDDGASPSDMEDYLDEDVGDDAMMEDDSKSTASTSTEFSTGSSVGSNTPSLIGENLESFCLGETEKGGASEGGAVGKNPNWVQTSPLVRSSIKPLRRSLFSHVPPTITFVHHNEVSETPLPAEVRKHLRWKLSNITPAVVKRIVTNSGYRLMRRTCTEWGGIWGKHMKSPQFKDVHEGQKLNHLPGTFNIGRKDRLWKNYQRLRLKFGKEEFSFLPRTFLLPSESKLLRRVWERRGCRAKWIVKPPALARGTGIKVVNKWSQIPKMRPLIVQKYVARPHLINNTKYDLRIYVLLTSLCPLRIFLYDEGLVRFASNAYSADNASLSDVYTHLTNYSINKFSSTYQANEDSDCRQGHKWTLASLWQYFAESGIDSAPVIDSIKDLVIKTIISAESSMFTVYRQNLASHYCGYELFGFDVLLDSKLKPWLIEVNISPSLHSSSPLDLDVKSPLATEVFNLARYHIPPAKMSARTQREVLSKLNMGNGVTQLCMDRKLYQRELSKSERAKHDKFITLVSTTPTSASTPNENTSNSVDADQSIVEKSPETCAKTTSSCYEIDRSLYLDSILEHLTPDDVRVLIRSEDELAQATHFSRIFPTQDTHKYFKYFETPRYYNLLFDAWERKYGGDHRAAAIDRLERLCVEKVHLKVPVPAGSTATGGVVQKNCKLTRIKVGAGLHPQPPLFPTLDVSSLKAPTGSSSIGQGFCGHHPPHSAGNLLDCVSTAEQEEVIKHVQNSNVPIESADAKNNTRTFIRPVNDISSSSKGPESVSSKVKVSQISLTVRPNCVKTGTPPLANPSRRAGSAAPKSQSAARKSLSSPEAMSIGGDDTTSSEKGSRSPSPIRSSTPPLLNLVETQEKRTEIVLDNDPKIISLEKNIGFDKSQMETISSSNNILPSTALETSKEMKNDNINGNIILDHERVS